MRWHKPAAVAATGLALVAYLVVRPALVAKYPYIFLAEFPAAVLVMGLLLWGAMREPRDARPPPAPPWHRHEQHVRALDDPEALRARAALDAWVREGAQAAEAADVLARASADDLASREIERERLLGQMNAITAPRKRAAFLSGFARNANASTPKTPGA